MIKRFFLFMFFASMLYCQTAEVINIQKVNIDREEGFFYPRFANNNTILLTTSNYKGLWIYSIDEKTLTKLNDHFGAGYEPVIFDKGKKIAFRMDEYIDRKKMSSIVIQNTADKTEQVLLARQRNIGTPKLLGDSTLFFYRSETPFTVSKIFNLESGFTPNDAIEVFINNSDLILVIEGESKILNPNGKANYIWPSVSPGKDRVLYTAAGKGTFICDLEGKILSEIGYANYPSWSPDGEWITYMKDFDDGHQVTASDIYVRHIQSDIEFAITKSTSKIEMYPSWSRSGEKVFFNTINGEIEFANIKFD